MKKYGLEDAKAIIRNYGGGWIEFKADGVHLTGELLQYDTSQVLHWMYVCELDESDSPNPLTAPCLPFPFTANELTAFMLDGVGADIASNYGNWEDGPDQAMLDLFNVRAREPKRAIIDAYAAHRAAQANVGKYPAELQKRADRLCKMYNYRNLKANAREGAFADGISRGEASARRERAIASNAKLEKLYEVATQEYQAASDAWRKAMVNQLLPTAPATKALPAHGTAPPAPSVAAKRRKKKPSIETVALNYMCAEFKQGQFQSASKFHKHLINTAGRDKSPFEMGTGINARKLFCPAASSFFDVGTLGKIWAKIRAV